MNKTMKFDLSEERLIELAEDRLDEADYIGALTLLRKRNERYDVNCDTYELAADIYEGMGVYDMAIRAWFHFLDAVEPEYRSEAYEGLGVNYMNFGNESQAAYYYNLLLKTEPNIPDEDKANMLASFSKPQPTEFHIVYPPEKADYSKELNDGLGRLREGDLEQAVACFHKVHPLSKQATTAKNLEAVCYLLAGRNDQAERICLEVLQSAPNDIPTLTTLAAVKNEKGDREASVAIARHLCTIPDLSSEEAYKIATVCCENDLHEEAYQKLNELSNETPYDGNLLYFKAVAAYLSGRLRESIDAFDLLVTVYPDAEVAKFYLVALRNEYRHHIPAPELTYFYRVPQEEREKRESFLLALSKLRLQDAEEYCILEGERVDSLLRWCFDEMDGQEQELQMLAVITAIHCNRRSFLQDILLDFQVKDMVKIETIRLLAERNRTDAFGIVICNIYRALPFYRLVIGQKSRKKFLEGYSLCYASFAIISDEIGSEISVAAGDLYRRLALHERYDCMEEPKALAAAIYLHAGIREAGTEMKNIAMLMGAEADRVSEILHVLE